ncbi:MAG: transglutaminase family protein [Burkholderiaceae bacterium]|jgi:transglutaminase-like putative cysteine protease|nr:transglutaminase family protein [Burkholderiaceae bacterium]MEB2317603.1 transglutaminase family protein [Pseudomonadota bacterium]
MSTARPPEGAHAGAREGEGSRIDASTLYDVRVAINYRYGSRVPFAKHVLRIDPENDARQEVLEASMVVEPAPSERWPEIDQFGNRTVMLALDSPHDRLEVRLGARIRVHAIEPCADSPAWESIRDAVPAMTGLSARAPAHFVFPCRMTIADADLVDYVMPSFAPGRPILDAAADLGRRIHADFRYAPGSTTVSTTALEFMRGRAGVCQDFAHLMIAGMRAIGLPIAYVSGLLRTVPPPGSARLEGADAMHAWVAVWGGPDIGWVGLDPTNAVFASSDHIRIGMGRAYADVAPIDGVIIAAGEHANDVAVDVVPLA